jgi:hypothetical protein
MKYFWVSPVSIGAKRVRAAMLLTFVFSMIGCAAKRVVLVPAPNATLAAQPNSAQDSSQGVSLLVQANAWNEYPRTLDRELIPIKVTLQNDSGRDLAIRYEDFVLIGANNRRFGDIRPDQIKGYDYEHLEPYWAFSDAYYAEVRLPTEAMLRQAISEGVVANGGEISGFLYFPRPSQIPQAISFSAALVDAHTKQKFGAIVVPLVVKSL